jgi:hypothetical protein
MSARSFGEIARGLVARTEVMRGFHLLLDRCSTEHDRHELTAAARDSGALTEADIAELGATA